jgi:Mlc titration factor MtfA (ptsG expression regulator)
VFSWLKHRQRRKLLATPFPQEWLDHLQRNVRHYHALSADEQRRLRDDLRVFVDDKYWELASADGSEPGWAGLQEVTDEMKVTIAAQACLLTLNILDQDYYKRVRTVLVYPTAFVSAHKRNLPGGVVSEGGANSGQAWFRGPMIISWSDALAGGRGHTRGRNLVMHEFAHALDMMDGLINGTPPLRNRQQYKRWHAVMTAEYRRLVQAAQQGEPTLLDQYGATDVGEFFAVATECFFEQGPYLRQYHPQLYGLLRDYFRHDPALWRAHDFIQSPTPPYLG